MINLGSINVTNLYIGLSQVSKVFLGYEQVWPADAYVAFKALLANSTVGLTKISTKQTLEYSRDLETWLSFDTTVVINLDDVDDIVYVRGILSDDIQFTDNTQFNMSGQIEVFGNCNALWNYENLNAPLKQCCGVGLFDSCNALANASKLRLPATILSQDCYSLMFYGCSFLTTAPKLPATKLALSCYLEMFSKCTRLIAAPELHATILAPSCYSTMFAECTNLTVAPELPAPILTDYCYNSMFWLCSNLNYIKCLAIDISAASCTQDWTAGVASGGTFYRDSQLTWSTGVNGIPESWTISPPLT